MDAVPRSSFRTRLDLFLISLLVLFMELAFIRWFPAHVLFLTFFTNLVLLACFLGLSIGCLTANRPPSYLAWTPVLLVVALLAAHGVNLLRKPLQHVLDVGQQSAPQMVFFGAEPPREDIAHAVLPVEVLNGFFFLVLALISVGPGQVLGRCLSQLPNRVAAYTLNILGSLVGIALFGLCSWAELSPLAWFLPIVLGLAYFLQQIPVQRWRLAIVLRVGLLNGILFLVSMTSGIDLKDGQVVAEHFWSPYYRVDYTPPPERFIGVNLISHQKMDGRDDAARLARPSGSNPSPAFAYALPHLLNRDARQVTGAKPQPFADVLIIGAGSGNDVSRALQWGAEHIDAVEIDPVVQRLGARDHPDKPYDDPRVTVHLDDGRNFLHSTEKQYDLIVYALVDSLVLHSSYSNIRLESYLFTRQAFADVKRRLKPGGLFVMYNYFRQGWIVTRLCQGVEEVFGQQPLVLAYPHQETIDPDKYFGGYTLLLTGDTDHLRHAFDQHGAYWVNGRQAPGPASPNGFTSPGPEERAPWVQALPGAAPWGQFGLAHVKPPREPLRSATDDWPFLYLRQPMIPGLTLRGMAVIGGLALLLLWLFAAGRKQAGGGGLETRLFFLGAGFMLIETKAVVHVALLFGSTWMVNSLVFGAVLLMILAANLLVLGFRPTRLGPWYIGLFAALALNVAVPLDSFLGLGRAWQVGGACFLLAAPILFAGVIFAVSFAQSDQPDRAFGANIAGAMLGGLAENLSMLLGFQYLVLVAVSFYALSALGMQSRRAVAKETTATPLAA